MGENSALKKYVVLYVDDEASNLQAFERNFRFDYEILLASSGAQALEILQGREVHLLLTDQRMPGMDGLQLLRQAMNLQPSAVRLLLTAFSDNEVLLQAIQEGKVYDYILKPWRRESLGQSLKNAVAFYQSQTERLQHLQRRAESAEAELREFLTDELIGAHSGLRAIAEQIQRVAPTDSTVLIRGESGTGKEVVARAIHRHSRRCENPFVRINASAFAAGVLESELFGHEKGAFTGALSQKKGRFELADGGTLFLDEIGDLPESVQVKLLRVLQEREFERVGGTRTLKVDVRLITATHRPLELLIEEGQFRSDLFYRVNVIPLQISPLRERREDIGLMTRHFLAEWNRQLGKQVSLSAQAQQKLTEYAWPGNVRELKNVVERLVVLADPRQVIEVHDLRLPEAQEFPPETLPAPTPGQNLRQHIQAQEARELQEILQRTRGNLAEAARILGMPRTTLFSRLKKYGLV